MAKALREPVEYIYSDEDLTNAHSEIESANRDLAYAINDIKDAQERIAEAMGTIEAYFDERSAPEVD